MSVRPQGEITRPAGNAATLDDLFEKFVFAQFLCQWAIQGMQLGFETTESGKQLVEGIVIDAGGLGESGEGGSDAVIPSPGIDYDLSVPVMLVTKDQDVVISDVATLTQVPDLCGFGG